MAKIEELTVGLRVILTRDKREYEITKLWEGPLAWFANIKDIETKILLDKISINDLDLLDLQSDKGEEDKDL